MFIKKVPKGAESCNILVGTMPFVNKPVTILARLKESVLLEDFCEISTNTRFLGMILGPIGSDQQITDMGKALGTIMSDQVRKIYRSLFFTLSLFFPGTSSSFILLIPGQCRSLIAYLPSFRLLHYTSPLSPILIHEIYFISLLF